MSTTSYPNGRPLVDATGKVAFPITHVKYVINAVDATNPVLKGSLKFGDDVVLQYDPNTKKVGPLGVKNGGTGVDNIADLASAVASQLGFTTNGTNGVIPISKGGTGSTNAAAALAALGGVSCARYTTTITAGSWTSASGGGYQKNFAIAGVTANDVPIAGLILSDDTGTAKTQLSAAANVQRIVALANSITLYAYNSAPTTNFNIQLMCIRGFTNP